MRSSRHNDRWQGENSGAEEGDLAGPGRHSKELQDEEELLGERLAHEG